MYARTWMPLLGATAIALTVSGCQRYDAAADIAAIQATIKADEKAWNEQFRARDLDKLAGRYAGDAYFVAPGAPPANGSAEIRKTYAAGLSDPALAVNFSSSKLDVSASGDLAYSRGRFTENFTDPATKRTLRRTGSYITVYKRQADGSWKVAEDFTVADPGEAKPAEPATRARMISL